MNWIQKQIKAMLNWWAKVSTPNPNPYPAGNMPTPKPPESGCTCDLPQPLVDPPWTGSELAAMGNGSECPTWRGLDIRLKCTYPVLNGGKTWLLGQLLPQAMGQKDGKLVCRCFTKDGLQYHFKGYSHNSGLMVACKAGDPFDYKTTTFVHYEARRGL